MCRQVRELVHAADPEVTETTKRTIFIYAPIVPDPEGIINQAQRESVAI